MYRNVRRWASSTILTDLFDPRWWLTAGGTVHPRATTQKREDASQLASHTSVSVGEKHGAPADCPPNDAAISEDDTELSADAGSQVNVDSLVVSSVDGSIAHLRFAGTAGAAGFQNGTAFAAATPRSGTHAHGGLISSDPLAPFLPHNYASTAHGSAPVTGAASASASASGSVVILESSPSAQSTAHVAGSSLFLAFGMPFGVCGCGYFTSPTRILDWAHGGSMLDRDGQLPGTRLTEGPDHSQAVKGTFGASVSDALLDRELSVASGWTGTARLTATALPSGSLPGGGEMSNGTATSKGIGILGGSVTTMPSTSQRASTQSLAATAAVAATATNVIVLENQKQGNPESEWGIDGAGSTNIEGFATDISVDNGKTINFKINTDSSNYRIDIYRLGYYGGMGARKVDSIQHTGLQSQPDPLRNAATGTVDAGNWAVSASWAVPGDAVSGVYIAKLVRQDGTFGENQIPFIVRDDDSHSDIVFQTADETWQAYNGWGGANFYGGNGPATGQGAGRAYAVSYNRPIATRGDVGTYAGPQDYLFGAEYAGIYWLEQNGYDVSYMSGVDVDRYGSLLLNHKTYVDAGHDEYWSGQQRANVEAARDAGVNLEFWSGNEVYWRTRWGNSYSSDATAYRTLISFQRVDRHLPRPAPQPTRCWRRQPGEFPHGAAVQG
jgi:hypothetical protein